MSLCSEVIYETNFLQEEQELGLLGCHTHGTGGGDWDGMCSNTWKLGNLLTKRTGERKTCEVVVVV